MPSARSARMPMSFAEPIGVPSPAAVLPASIVTASGEAPVPWIWTLQRMHRPASGMMCRCGGVRCRVVGQGRTNHLDEVLVVGAVELVGVGDRAGLVLVVRDLVLVAGRVVGRLGARLGLGVEAGHDLDPVVVV